MDHFGELYCVKQAMFIATSSLAYLDALRDGGLAPYILPRRKNARRKKKTGSRILPGDTDAHRKSLSLLRERLKTADLMLSSAGFPAIPAASLLSILREAQRHIARELTASNWPSRSFLKCIDAVDLLFRTACDFQARIEGRGLTETGVTPVVRCLVISDLHLGMTDAVMGNVQNSLIKAIDAIHKTFPVDVILFVGDLVQSGKQQQFTEFNALLGKIWDKFKPSCNPILLTIPGNHDIERIHEDHENATKLLDGSSSDDDFWKDADLRGVIERAFKSYESWARTNIILQQSEGKGIISHNFGALPGDFSCTIIKHNFKLGILGLNSAFAGVSTSDCKGKLVMRIGQADKACQKPCADWVDDHDTAIVLTHHPLDWLTEKARRDFEREINANQRFGLHLCGHLHTTGNNPRFFLQTPSLFGLAKFQSDAGEIVDRIHGFCLLEISPTPTGFTYRTKTYRLSTHYEWRDEAEVSRLDRQGWTDKVEYRKHSGAPRPHS